MLDNNEINSIIVVFRIMSILDAKNINIQTLVSRLLLLP